jgi:hypothetical protein
MSVTHGDPPAHVSQRWRLKPGLRKALLTLHIALAVGLLGEVWALMVLNTYSTLTPDQELARSAYRLMEVLVFASGIPFSVLTLIIGIVLAVTSPWGLTRYYWVFVKLLLALAVPLFGMFLFQPAVRAAAIEAGTSATGDQWLQVTVVTTQLVMLVAATTLAVFKPRWRLR